MHGNEILLLLDYFDMQNVAKKYNSTGLQTCGGNNL